MTPPAAIELTESACAAIAAHSRDTYPEECCGVVLSNMNRDEVRPLPNIQNILHEKDPQTFPRDARTAYSMDTRVLDALLTEADRKGLRVKAFYHSHPDHDAYFSEEDKACATPFGEPTHPDSAQIVVSVMNGRVGRIGVYVWSDAAADFEEISLERVPDP